MTPQNIYSSDDLPLLTEVVNHPDFNDLPILTEVVAEETQTGEPHSIADQPTASAAVLPRTLSAEEMQYLLQQLETHLETVFTGKLNRHIEQLQKLAVDLAISELKAELPQLLRDALTNTDVSR
ncbi:MAG: hypothetical protein Q8L80_11485 [Gallionella sp.]|nr:hypothetical protein [Gallionella sp.]MDP1939369.1 hypothetical protein [Gallionella sp.]